MWTLRYVQVFTAIVDSFSHGANDVANAMGPYAAGTKKRGLGSPLPALATNFPFFVLRLLTVYITWKNGYVSSDSEVGNDMIWILALGGIGIGVGLATYGYKIMKALGVKLTAITPSRGFCIELGAAFVIIFGTTQGWPLSTTHCQVGATVGVGLFEGCGGCVDARRI